MSKLLNVCFESRALKISNVAAREDAGTPGKTFAGIIKACIP
jgi:hypothetical protein